jgi:hypothetical protein
MSRSFRSPVPLGVACAMSALVLLAPVTGQAKTADDAVQRLLRQLRGVQTDAVCALLGR